MILNRRLNSLWMIFFCTFLPVSIALSAQVRWTRMFYPLEKPHHYIRNWKTIAFSGGGFLGMGGCLKGHEYSLLVWRWDPQGNLIWLKKYASKSSFGDLLDNGDGTFTLTATDWDHATDKVPPWSWVIVCNSSGGILSQWNYSLAPTQLAARSSTGDLYLIDVYDDTVLKTDGINGGGIWHKRFHPTQGLFPAEEATAIEAASDGGFILAAGSGTSNNSSVLVRVNSDGQVLWAKDYESNSKNDPAPNYPRLALTADGGFLLVADTSQTAAGDTALFRLDSSGNVEWQERLLSADYPQMTPALIRTATESDDGTIFVSGTTGYLDGHMGLTDIPFLAALAPSGVPLWCQLYGNPIVDEYGPHAAWQVADGVIFTSAANDPNRRSDPAGPSLSKVDSMGSASEVCGSFPFNLHAQTTTFVWGDISQVVTDASVPEFRTTHASAKKVRATDTMVCGDPVITAIAQASSPFRLRLKGWNLQETDTVFVGGVQVPKTTFQGRKPDGETTILVHGRGLKTMLPKGQSVCITVVSSSGDVSPCFMYTR